MHTSLLHRIDVVLEKSESCQYQGSFRHRLVIKQRQSEHRNMYSALDWTFKQGASVAKPPNKKLTRSTLEQHLTVSTQKKHTDSTHRHVHDLCKDAGVKNFHDQHYLHDGWPCQS